MKYLHYDEVDPQDAFMLNIDALWWAMTPKRVEDYLKYDDRWSSDSFLYAVDKGKVVSQVVGLRIPTKTVEGEELVLGVAGVATHPSYSRKGFSTKLMQELHERSREEGLRIAFLLTRASLVAYRMYEQLGYRDVSYFLACTKKLARKKKPKKSILRKFKKKDVPEIDKIFKRFSRGLTGFVIRQEKYFDWRMKIAESLKGLTWIVETNDKVCGYIVKRESGDNLFLEEMVIPSRRIADRVLNELERGEKGDYITAFPLAGKKQLEYVKSRGYMADQRSWGRVMATPLTKKLTYKELARLYKFNEGDFCLLELDHF